MRIGILATGRMARGLARGYAKSGHDVTLASRNPKRAKDAAASIVDTIRSGTHEDAVRQSETVVLAVPFGNAADTVRPLADLLMGKIVIDITNPFGTVPTGQIAGIEHNAKSASGARWVAAYKTNFWKTLDQPVLANGNKRDVLVCASDEEAKRTVMELIEQTGFRAVDCGRLENARTVDLMVPLMIELDGRYGRDSLSSWKFLDAES